MYNVHVGKRSLPSDENEYLIDLIFPASKASANTQSPWKTDNASLL